MTHKATYSVRGGLRALVVVLFGVLGIAGPAMAGSHPMHFDHLTLDDGLSQSNVLSVLQDSDGWLWIGTENGLNRYNGYEFEYFKRERGNSKALRNDFVFDLEEAADGSLWIATNGGGLANYDKQTGEFRSYRHYPAAANGISANIVRSLLVDRHGIVWIGTREHGLDSLNPETGEFKHFSFADRAQDTVDTIFALYEDSDNVLWVGGSHGLTRLNTETGAIKSYVLDASDKAPLSGVVRAITRDSLGQLWVGTQAGGLKRLDEESGEFTQFRHDEADSGTISSNEVSAIFEDSAERLWVGTNRGLNLVDRRTGRATRFAHDSNDPASLGDDTVTTIYEDNSGLLWVGTKSRGLNKWNPRSWSFGFEPAREITVSKEARPNVSSFVEGTDGRLWVGTFGDGLNVIDRKTGESKHYRADADSQYRIADNRVMSLLRARDGAIWFGTMSNGIGRIDAETGNIESFRHNAADSSSLSANGVMTIYEDSAGFIWVGTFGGGISRYNPQTGKFQRFNADPGNPVALSSNRVTSFKEDPSGRMWIGTDAGGLNLYDPQSGAFHHFAHDPNNPHTLAADTVYSINVDADGTVWVGTQGGGLDRVVGSVTETEQIRFANVSQKNGLVNDVIYGIEFDQAGWLWLSTNYGISRYHPETGQIKNMHRKDGLQSEEFNFGAHYRSDSGELFFGGHNGFNAFNPADLGTSNTVPLIALTGFFIKGDPVKSDIPHDTDTALEIGWKDDVVSFEFAALDFSSPEQNRYMYKLEGFDDQWIDLGNRRRVTYTDLNKGNYLLRVKAANSEGVWNEAGFAMPLHVTAAPWETWWAYLAYIAAFAQLGFLLWSGHRRKVEREESYSRQLENEVNLRTEKLLDKNQQLRDLNKALQESSLSDPLTGLRNRRFVFEEITRDLEMISRKREQTPESSNNRDSAELVFMMIDMDNFKPINDTYGHAAGDQVLLEFRDVLLSVCRRSDFIIRWGGDEFVVIAKQASGQEAEALAERIRVTIAEHEFTVCDDQIVRTTCSIGFAAFPMFRTQTDETGLDQIISLADGLMYEAKTRRNAWVGMMNPSSALTSFDFDHETIEPTSMLFRARRAGTLGRYSADAENEPFQAGAAG